MQKQYPDIFQLFDDFNNLIVKINQQFKGGDRKSMLHSKFY